MAEPFKNQLSAARITVIAGHLARHYAAFNHASFMNMAIANLAELSLMERNRQIVAALIAYLPANIPQSYAIIENALAPYEQQQDEFGLHSWLVIPVAEYVGRTGSEHTLQAMTLLGKLTTLFSSEWGIRHLLINRQAETMTILFSWCRHENEHVRRLVSEGSRPRLPWGVQLPAFIQDPTKTFALLNLLKDDESEYVRLSVANHLNDISKDHPCWLQQQLQHWMAPENKERCKLIRHACRTLIKQGHAATLSMLGYEAFQVNEVVLTITQGSVKFGESLVFDLSFSSDQPQDVIVDYAIHFKKSNGTNSAKVFKWKVCKLTAHKPVRFTKKHTIKAITTRRYYNGEHLLEILINGQSVALKTFELSQVPVQ